MVEVAHVLRHFHDNSQISIELRPFLHGTHLIAEHHLAPVGMLPSSCITTSNAGRELRQLDVARCRQLRAALEHVKRVESAVASSAGLAMLFADPEVALSPEYLRMLESLAAAASEHGQLAGGALRDLPVRVRSSSGGGVAGSPAQAASRLFADEDLGMVIVSVDASAREVLAYLEVRHSPAAEFSVATHTPKPSYFQSLQLCELGWLAVAREVIVCKIPMPAVCMYALDSMCRRCIMWEPTVEEGTAGIHRKAGPWQWRHDAGAWRTARGSGGC